MLASELLRRVLPGADDAVSTLARFSVGGAASMLAQAFELDDGEINPAAPAADYLITPPPGYYMIALRWGVIQTQLDGTLTSAAVSSVGNDASFGNVVQSGAVTFGTLMQINTAPTGLKQNNASLSTLNPAISNLVATDTPFKLRITTPAVLNTATIYRVRCFIVGPMIPVAP